MNFSKCTFQDLYYDGEIDPQYEFFDEDSQEVYQLIEEDWFNDDFMEFESDEYLLKLKNGEIERIEK